MVHADAFEAGCAHPAQPVKDRSALSSDSGAKSAGDDCSICEGTGDTPMIYHGRVVPCYVCSGTGQLRGTFSREDARALQG
jgi:DnaJ-class molecular chaperone